MPTKTNLLKFNEALSLENQIINKKIIIISLIQHFEADFLWKVSLKILNLGLIMKKSTHATGGVRDRTSEPWVQGRRFITVTRGLSVALQTTISTSACARRVILLNEGTDCFDKFDMSIRSAHSVRFSCIHP